MNERDDTFGMSAIETWRLDQLLAAERENEDLHLRVRKLTKALNAHADAVDEMRRRYDAIFGNVT
jgi:hypothetical protein